METTIDQRRLNFWKWFLSEFYQDCKNRFSYGPVQFKKAEKLIYDQIMFSLIHNLDTILTPTIVCYIAENKNGENEEVYPRLFSENHQSTLDTLEKFHSPTLVNIYHRYRRFKSHFYKMTERIFVDWQELKSQFGLDDNDALISLRLTCGDEHFYGGQTSVLRFGNVGKGFVYKPVGIKLDLLMQELRIVFDKAQKNVIISKSGVANNIDGDFGYIGLYKPISETQSIEHAKSLYRDFGKLLAWGKFFKITDGHCDNIIISKDSVQWIDLESAFHFTQESVYKVHPLEETGLIYEAKAENTYIGIITGIQGGTIPRLALTSPVVYRDGTDKMYIRYFKKFTPTDCYNRIYYNGTLCKPEDFINDIKTGYVESINRLYKHRTNILQYVRRFFASNLLSCRYLVQTTASYARFISLLNHIMAIRNNDVLSQIRNERQKTFIGREKAIQKFMLDNEIIDIVNGVVPYFYRTNKSNALYHASGAFRDNFFNNTLYEDIEKHILSIKIDDSTLQSDCEFISKALNSTAGISNFEDFKVRFNFPMFDFDSELNQS